MSEQNPTPAEQPAPQETVSPETQPAEKSVAEGQDAETPEPEEEIDLNHIFPEAETDLNELFPEPEMRALLKKVHRNTKDLGKMKNRFSDTFQDND